MESKPDRCSVCLKQCSVQVISGQKPAQLNCGHSTCFRCLQTQWLTSERNDSEEMDCIKCTLATLKEIKGHISRGHGPNDRHLLRYHYLPKDDLKNGEHTVEMSGECGKPTHDGQHEVKEMEGRTQIHRRRHRRAWSYPANTDPQYSEKQPRKGRKRSTNMHSNSMNRVCSKQTNKDEYPNESVDSPPDAGQDCSTDHGMLDICREVLGFTPLKDTSKKKHRDDKTSDKKHRESKHMTLPEHSQVVSVCSNTDTTVDAYDRRLLRVLSSDANSINGPCVPPKSTCNKSHYKHKSHTKSTSEKKSDSNSPEKSGLNQKSSEKGGQKGNTYNSIAPIDKRMDKATRPEDQATTKGQHFVRDCIKQTWSDSTEKLNTSSNNEDINHQTSTFISDYNGEIKKQDGLFCTAEVKEINNNVDQTLEKDGNETDTTTQYSTPGMSSDECASSTRFSSPMSLDQYLLNDVTENRDKLEIQDWEECDSQGEDYSDTKCPHLNSECDPLFSDTSEPSRKSINDQKLKEAQAETASEQFPAYLGHQDQANDDTRKYCPSLDSSIINRSGDLYYNPIDDSDDDKLVIVSESASNGDLNEQTDEKNEEPEPQYIGMGGGDSSYRSFSNEPLRHASSAVRTKEDKSTAPGKNYSIERIYENKQLPTPNTQSSNKISDQFVEDSEVSSNKSFQIDDSTEVQRQTFITGFQECYNTSIICSQLASRAIQKLEATDHPKGSYLMSTKMLTGVLNILVQQANLASEICIEILDNTDTPVSQRVSPPETNDVREIKAQGVVEFNVIVSNSYSITDNSEPDIIPPDVLRDIIHEDCEKGHTSESSGFGDQTPTISEANLDNHLHLALKQEINEDIDEHKIPELNQSDKVSAIENKPCKVCIVESSASQLDCGRLGSSVTQDETNFGSYINFPYDQSLETESTDMSKLLKSSTVLDEYAESKAYIKSSDIDASWKNPLTNNCETFPSDAPLELVERRIAEKDSENTTDYVKNDAEKLHRQNLFSKNKTFVVCETNTKKHISRVTLDDKNKAVHSSTSQTKELHLCIDLNTETQTEPPDKKLSHTSSEKSSNGNTYIDEICVNAAQKTHRTENSTDTFVGCQIQLDNRNNVCNDAKTMGQRSDERGSYESNSGYGQDSDSGENVFVSKSEVSHTRQGGREGHAPIPQVSETETTVANGKDPVNSSSDLQRGDSTGCKLQVSQETQVTEKELEAMVVSVKDVPHHMYADHNQEKQTTNTAQAQKVLDKPTNGKRNLFESLLLEMEEGLLQSPCKYRKLQFGKLAKSHTGDVEQLSIQESKTTTRECKDKQQSKAESGSPAKQRRTEGTRRRVNGGVKENKLNPKSAGSSSRQSLKGLSSAVSGNKPSAGNKHAHTPKSKYHSACASPLDLGSQSMRYSRYRNPRVKEDEATTSCQNNAGTVSVLVHGDYRDVCIQTVVQCVPCETPGKSKRKLDMEKALPRQLKGTHTQRNGDNSANISKFAAQDRRSNGKKDKEQLPSHLNKNVYESGKEANSSKGSATALDKCSDETKGKHCSISSDRFQEQHICDYEKGRSNMNTCIEELSSRRLGDQETFLQKPKHDNNTKATVEQSGTDQVTKDICGPMLLCDSKDIVNTANSETNNLLSPTDDNNHSTVDRAVDEEIFRCLPSSSDSDDNIPLVDIIESMRTPKNDHTTKTPKTDNTNSTRDVDCWNDELPHLYVPSVSSQSRNLSQRRTRCERPSLDTFLEIQNSLAGNQMNIPVNHDETSEDTWKNSLMPPPLQAIVKSKSREYILQSHETYCANRTALVVRSSDSDREIESEEDDNAGGDTSRNKKKKRHRRRKCDKPVVSSSSEECIPRGRKRGFQWRQECLRILDQVYNHRLGDPFRHEVKSRDIPDYYKIVKRGMCFDIIGYKLRCNIYEELREFFLDIRLVFDNCQLYHQPKSPVYQAGLVVKHFFRKTAKEILMPRTTAMSSQKDGKKGPPTTEFQKYT